MSCVHHPFTAPAEEHAAELAALLRELPLGGALDEGVAARLLRVRGQHYDLVVNGVELGGGSVRIHCPATQRGVLERVLRVPPGAAAGFDHLLAALDAGAPPHGGFALGLDRLVGLLAGPAAAPSLRDVIAFPKSAAGNDLLTGAPAPVDDALLREYHVRVVE